MTLYYLTIDDCDGLQVEAYASEHDRAVAAASYVPDSKVREALMAETPGTPEWFEVFDDWLSESYLDIRFVEGCVDFGDNKTVLVLLPNDLWEDSRDPETRTVRTTKSPEDVVLDLVAEFDGDYAAEEFRIMKVLEGHQ